MITYYNLPSNIDNLISRLRAEAVEDSQTSVITSLDAIGKIYWYNLPSKLNELKSIIITYQTYLIDGDLQDLIEEIGTIYWYDLAGKVALLIEAVELIENL